MSIVYRWDNNKKNWNIFKIKIIIAMHYVIPQKITTCSNHIGFWFFFKKKPIPSLDSHDWIYHVNEYGYWFLP